MCNRIVIIAWWSKLGVERLAKNGHRNDPSYKLQAWYRRVVGDLGSFHRSDIDETPACHRRSAHFRGATHPYNGSMARRNGRRFHCDTSTSHHFNAPTTMTPRYPTTVHWTFLPQLQSTASPLLHCTSLHCTHYTAPPLLHCTSLCSLRKRKRKRKNVYSN